VYGLWAVSLTFVLSQLIMSWFQRPFTVTPEQSAKLDRLLVAAVIPCYNEDPAILNRTIYSLFSQTRPLDWVIVVDAGSGHRPAGPGPGRLGQSRSQRLNGNPT